jgi:hypothetical protein
VCVSLQIEFDDLFYCGAIRAETGSDSIVIKVRDEAPRFSLGRMAFGVSGS